MPHNTDEEHLGNPNNRESENSSDEIILTNKPGPATKLKKLKIWKYIIIPIM